MAELRTGSFSSVDRDFNGTLSGLRITRHLCEISQNGFDNELGFILKMSPKIVGRRSRLLSAFRFLWLTIASCQKTQQQ